jgi:hypothetical protein
MVHINIVNFHVEYVTRRDEKSRHEVFSQMSVRAVLPFAYSEPSYFWAMFSMVLVNGIVNQILLKTPVAFSRRHYSLRQKGAPGPWFAYFILARWPRAFLV